MDNPWVHRQLQKVDSRRTVGLAAGGQSVFQSVGRSVDKRWAVGQSVDTWWTAGRHRADRWGLTVGGQSVDGWWTVGVQSVESLWIVCGQSVDSLWTACGQSANLIQQVAANCGFKIIH